MNILIVGKNKINAALQECFKSEGFEPIVVEDASNIKSFVGEAGDFCACTPKGELKAQYVVVTEEATNNGFDIGGGAVLPITDEVVNKISGANFKTPIVFLLDYKIDSSKEDTMNALNAAILLAQKKRKVVYLSKFVRTANAGVEELYRQARAVGVTFIKYEDLKIEYDGDNNVFAVNTSDGIFELSFKTPYVVGPSIEQSAKYLQLAKKLRIKTYKNNVSQDIINKDRYFLDPALTGRKGIFYIDSNDGISYLTAIIKQGPDKPEKYAVVDKFKCAFCYTCYRACPHGAMEPDNQASAMINKNTACEACGICVAVCPAAAITLNTEEACEEMAKKPGRMKIFCCENSAELALKQILPELGPLAAKIDFESIACGGHISLENLAGALRYYDKVVVAVCVDQACKHFEGNKRACLTVNRLAEQLKKAEIAGNRVELLQVSHAMTSVLKDKLCNLN